MRGPEGSGGEGYCADFAQGSPGVREAGGRVFVGDFWAKSFLGILLLFHLRGD